MVAGRYVAGGAAQAIGQSISSIIGSGNISIGIARGASAVVFRSRVGRRDSHISNACLLYTSPSPRDRQKSRMPSSA